MSQPIALAVESDGQYEVDSIKDAYNQLTKRYDALFELNKLLHECDNISDFYQQVHKTISTLMYANNFYIALCDLTLGTFEFKYYADEVDELLQGTLTLDDMRGSLTRLVIERGKPLFLTQPEMRRLEQEGLVRLVGKECVDWLGVPLIDQGTVIGVMVVQSYDETQVHKAEDISLLNFAGQQVIAALTRLHDQEQMKKAVDARTRELMMQIRERERSELLQESLYKISELSNNSSLEIERFYDQVHNIVGQLINAENFYIAKLDKKDNRLDFVFFLDKKADVEPDKFASRDMGSYGTELIIRKQQTLLLDRKALNELRESGEISIVDPETHSWLGVPLMTDGQTIGAMVVQSYHGAIEYNQQDGELLNFVARHVASAIKRRELIAFERKTHEILEHQVKIRTEALVEEIKQRKQAEQQLKYQASHDSLTGLANRNVFVDLLNHAIACRKRTPDLQFALLFLDLDRFKVVNDSLGHHAGDLLLKAVAEKLTDIVREKDTVARLGGDEFVVLIEDLVNENEAFQVAKRITDLLHEAIMIEGNPVFVGSSIGVLFSDDRYETAAVMLRDADTAMYHAKEKGKGRYEVFDTSMQQKVQDALLLEADIRHALKVGEFVPYFQPIINLDNNEIVGFEALARWQSEKRGFVFPNEFIPISEETGLVKGIDLQIFEKSCEKLKAWMEVHGDNDLYISCNLFCDHFFEKDFADEILAVVERVGIEHKHLRVEIVERALLDSNTTVLENMKALREAGIKILLDDFGTGYSSLSYLHQFPIDVLKIDRSFISNIKEHDKHSAIIKTIIDLATNLKMSTVAEGIEHEQDAIMLKAMGCKNGQGYFYAKPKAAEEALQLI